MKKWIFLVGILVSSIDAFASVKFATYNIRHFDSSHSQTNKFELKKILNKLDANFLTVQEIVNTASFESFFKKNYPDYQVVFSRCGGGGKQKIGFAFDRNKFQLTRLYEDARLSDPSTSGEFGCGRLRPALVGEFKHKEDGERFVVIGVHLKAGGRPSSYQTRTKQYSLLSQMVKELELQGHQNVLLMGDFNTTGFNLNDVDFRNFSDMLVDMKMKSVAEGIKCTSYWAGENRNDDIEESSVLDHILYPSRFMGMRMDSFGVHSHCQKMRCANTSARNLGISYQEVTDHCPVSLTFK